MIKHSDTRIIGSKGKLIARLRIQTSGDHVPQVSRRDNVELMCACVDVLFPVGFYNVPSIHVIALARVKVDVLPRVLLGRISAHKEPLLLIGTNRFVNVLVASFEMAVALFQRARQGGIVYTFELGVDIEIGRIASLAAYMHERVVT